MTDALARARLSLEGLSVADAFGEQLLHVGPEARSIALEHHTAPLRKTWMWTDDTAMALSIVETLAAFGEVILGHSRTLRQRYHLEPREATARAAHEILDAIYGHSVRDGRAPRVRRPGLVRQRWRDALRTDRRVLLRRPRCRRRERGAVGRADPCASRRCRRCDR